MWPVQSFLLFIFSPNTNFCSRRCDLNAGERNYNVCFYMFSFMMVRNEIIKWQWNNIFQSKSRFAPCWWPPRSSSATSVPSRFTLLLYKPQFFSRSKIEISIKIVHGQQQFGGALYFLHTQNHMFSEWCPPWYSNSTWGASGKGGTNFKTISP